MKFKLINILPFFLFLTSCSFEKSQEINTRENIREQVQKLSQVLTEAEKNDDLKSFLTFYSKNAISMPEYQPILVGIDEIESFYKEIFHRQNIKNYTKSADEFIHMDSTIIEIGTFTKEYTDSNIDSLLIQNGKYWNIWAVQPDGSYKLKGELYGLFHQVQNPASLTVNLEKSSSDESEIYSEHEIPLELRAYSALDASYVKRRAGSLKSDYYTHDAKFMPFADSTVSGIENIKPYFIEYNRGEVNIDSISVNTFYFEYFNDYVLEYSKFKVKWRVEPYSGSTAGKGIRLWKRQDDKSLKIFRHVGSHDHLE